MHFSIKSLLGFSCLSLLASTGLAAGNSQSSDNTEVIVEIYQLLHNYSHILDGKTYSDLSYVLKEDAAFHLPTLNYTGRATAEQRYESEFLNKITLHTTQNVIVQDISATTATVLADAVTTYFGQGNLTGDFVTTYSKLTYIVTKENGSWMISDTTVAAGSYYGNQDISSTSA
ncbi:hypothetical protein MMC29_000549 [Sticta canariensis]|nr:hypothetical protein [Sticta canariensis]